jgi:hypothetical protein
MRLVYALVFGLLFCFQVSGQFNSTVAGVYAEARSGEVYTCGCLFSSEPGITSYTGDFVLPR